MTLRDVFVGSRGFPLDEFQVRALDALDAGRSVLVAAPTGSGKTVVAEYAVEKALAEGRKVFYTTPLKALSNQKYGDLARTHGAGRVGLLTGDNSVNGEAPVVVMTTEVLRNMIYAASPTLEGLRYVVLDEVHYLQNPYRGAVWEEVIIHLAPEVDLVCLSATVSNAEEFADWIQTVRGETEAVIEERRPVRLRHLYLVGDRQSEDVHILPTFVEAEAPDGSVELRPNPEASRLDSRSSRRGGPAMRGRPRGRLYPPRRIETVERLDDEGMLPAIYFIFSRAGCDQAVDACLAAGLRLTDPEARERIRAIAEAHVETLSDTDLELLGYGAWEAGLEAGFAAHHAGMVPPMKEAVEEAFAAGLVKVVFATETLSLGINMPARTVVIEKLSKFTGERHEFLTPGEYTQLTGRAGRRGIDDLGYAAVLWNPYVPFDQVASLASTRSYALASSFRPTYNMAANLVRRYPSDVAHHLLNLSFAQYGADKEIVRLERQLERGRELLASHRRGAECERGDVEEYRALLRNRAERRRAARGIDGGAGGPSGFEALKPGDVIARRGNRAVVLQRTRGRGDETKLLVLTADRGVMRLGPTDFAGPVRAIGAIDLPRPFAPRSPSFRRAVAEALRTVKVHSAGRTGGSGGAEAALAGVVDGDAVRSHPVAGCPELSVHLRYAERAERLARDVERLERRIRGRTESLARQFDRVLRVLESWGYVDGWQLTGAGEMLTRLYSETDLLLAESLREGLLDGLDGPSTAAVCSVFSYESRGPDQGAAHRVRFPNRTVRDRVAEIDRIWRDLNVAEDDAGLPETRPPDGGFAAAAHAWAKGLDLEAVLLDEELTGGDFVRNVKQLIDLLRQVGDVAPSPATASAARSAADALFRGVVAASSTVGATGARAADRE